MLCQTNTRIACSQTKEFPVMAFTGGHCPRASSPEGIQKDLFPELVLSEIEHGTFLSSADTATR